MKKKNLRNIFEQNEELHGRMLQLFLPSVAPNDGIGIEIDLN